MKLNYLIIPLAVIAVAAAGGWLTDTGGWYQSLNFPAWMPPNFLFSIVWTVIFVLAAIAALIIFNIRPASGRRRAIMVGFIINGLLNVGWSYLFFVRHGLWAAVIEALWLSLSVVCLILLIWPHHETEEEVYGVARKKSLNRLAAALFLPYLVWSAFATYLTYAIWSLN